MTLNHFTGIGVLAAVGFLAPTEPAFGQDDGDAVEEEIIVLGARLEETIPLDLEQFGNRVEIITADELELGGFNDLAQSLQMRVPGLYLAPKNGAFDYVGCSLQGSRCQDILWLIDGVRINNRLYNSTSPLDTVPAHMVERIEVLYGGQGNLLRHPIRGGRGERGNQGVLRYSGGTGRTQTGWQ